MKFFVLQNVAGSRYDAEVVRIEPRYGTGLVCPACGRTLTAPEWTAPHRAELEVRGEALGDVVFGPSLDLLISERFLEAWRAEKLSGLYGLRDVEIAAVRPESARPEGRSRYFLAHAGFGMTQVDEKRSHMEREGEVDCLQCMGGTSLRAVSGFSIDEPTWSGEDVFLAWGFEERLVATERALALREKYGLTNMLLEPTESFVWKKPT